MTQPPPSSGNIESINASLPFKVNNPKRSRANCQVLSGQRNPILSELKIRRKPPFQKQNKTKNPAERETGRHTRRNDTSSRKFTGWPHAVIHARSRHPLETRQTWRAACQPRLRREMEIAAENVMTRWRSSCYMPSWMTGARPHLTTN